MRKFRTFGQRFCTYCGTNQMYYIDFDGSPLGVCNCGNVDWCDNETETEVKKTIWRQTKIGRHFFFGNGELGVLLTPN